MSAPLQIEEMPGYLVAKFTGAGATNAREFTNVEDAEKWLLKE